MKEQIKDLLKQLDALLVAHFYQKDEIVDLATFSGDSLELAKAASLAKENLIIFCGVSFMGQSVKILAPQKRVIMPKLACCSMAKMIDEYAYQKNLDIILDSGIKKEDIFPITYINSSAAVKAEVGKMGGVVCTSSNAETIFKYALDSNKKIFFLPDRCLGQNLSDKFNLKSCVLGYASSEEIKNADVLCFDGFCSVHQLFSVNDVKFYREKYKDILIVVHPECDPSVVKMADFVGSTSQIIKFVKSLPKSQAVAVGTEFNLVNRLRPESNNTFVLSSSIPMCPTMNETSLKDILLVLEAAKENKSSLFKSMNEVIIPNDVAKYAKIALDKMLELS